MSTSRNTLYNIGGAVVSLVIAVVTLPLYIHRVGEARYGVLAIVWLLLGYFGLFDMGLGRATAQAVAANAAAGPKEQNDIVWAALFVNLGFGVLGGLALWVAAHWIPKQDNWIYERLHRLNAPVAIGVGAAFAFAGRTVQRCPQWISRMGFEWVYLFLREPKKMWRRDLIDGPRLLFHLGLELIRNGRLD